MVAQLAVGRYWITNTNDLLPQGIYEFDEDGMMINPPANEEPGEPDDPTEPPVVKDGIVEENGGLFYYKNGQKQYAAGLIKLDDGSFIYVRSNAQLAVGNYWVTNHNGYVPEGLYTFDAQGRMVNPPV